jgi:hypothetical protein
LPILIPRLYRNPYVISDARSVNKTFTVQWSICDKSYICSKYVANQLKKGRKAKSGIFFFSQVLLEKGIQDNKELITIHRNEWKKYDDFFTQ